MPPEAQPEWNAVCSETLAAMAAFVLPFTTCIARSDIDDVENGRAFGTGNYVRTQASIVLTNEHVARAYQNSILTHLPTSGDYYVRFDQSAVGDPHPVDAAALPVNEFEERHDRRWLSLSQFDSRYNPMEHELLFWLGYPGTTGYRLDGPAKQRPRDSLFGELSAPARPIVSQAIPDQVLDDTNEFDPLYHIAIHYPAVASSAEMGGLVNTWCPHGMSGSLLWDTKRIAAISNGTNWSPTDARVCGLVWGAHVQPDCVIATRIEHLSDLLKAEFKGIARAR